MERLVSLMGGWDKFVRLVKKILPKPNLLMKKVAGRSRHNILRWPGLICPGHPGSGEVMLLWGLALVDP